MSIVSAVERVRFGQTRANGVGLGAVLRVNVTKDAPGQHRDYQDAYKRQNDECDAAPLPLLQQRIPQHEYAHRRGIGGQHLIRDQRVPPTVAALPRRPVAEAVQLAGSAAKVSSIESTRLGMYFRAAGVIC